MTQSESPPSAARLDELLSEPSPAVVEALRDLPGDIVVLGAAGKMGPTLTLMAQRASELAGVSRRIVAVARFTNPEVAEQLTQAGIEVHRADLLDPAAVAALPDAAHVIYMVGQKFGTAMDTGRTWSINAFVPGLVAARYPNARMVAFSTGNVYPLWPVDSKGPTEDDSVGPIGEYAQSALARERVLSHFSRIGRTPMTLLRLNYAVEPRYGVLRDIAEKVWQQQPVDITMGCVNIIGQRDANAIAIRSLQQCTSPPMVLNVTGPTSVAVRDLATRFGARWRKPVHLQGREAPTALLSNAARMVQLFGPPPTSLEALIDQVATWMEQGGGSLGKATHFEQREGSY